MSVCRNGASLWTTSTILRIRTAVRLFLTKAVGAFAPRCFEVKRPRQWKWVDEDARPKEVREPAQSPAPVTTSPEPVPSTGALPTPWPTIHYRIARCIPKGARRVLADRDSSEVPNALSYAAQPRRPAARRSDLQSPDPDSRPARIRK
jgi:hypothetical protein